MILTSGFSNEALVSSNLILYTEISAKLKQLKIHFSTDLVAHTFSMQALKIEWWLLKHMAPIMVFKSFLFRVAELKVLQSIEFLPLCRYLNSESDLDFELTPIFAINLSSALRSHLHYFESNWCVSEGQAGSWKQQKEKYVPHSSSCIYDGARIQVNETSV